MNYLTVDEQFKKNINNEEISRIKDTTLRSIREKYWSKLTAAFLDEANIPDAELGNVMDKLLSEEKDEIEKYITDNNINYNLDW